MIGVNIYSPAAAASDVQLIPTISDSDLAPRLDSRPPHSFQMTAPRFTRSIKSSGDKTLKNFKTSTNKAVF